MNRLNAARDCGIKRTAASNQEGYYTVGLLQRGDYSLTVEMQGFKPIVRSGIQLDVHQVARIDFVMEVGEVTQKVEGGGDIEIKGRWQGNDFVVERKVSGGGKVTEDYLRSQDGKQLYVIVKFEGGRGRSIEFRRVYDVAAAM